MTSFTVLALKNLRFAFLWSRICNSTPESLLRMLDLHWTPQNLEITSASERTLRSSITQSTQSSILIDSKLKRKRSESWRDLIWSKDPILRFSQAEMPSRPSRHRSLRPWIASRALPHSAAVVRSQKRRGTEAWLSDLFDWEIDSLTFDFFRPIEEEQSLKASTPVDSWLITCSSKTIFSQRIEWRNVQQRCSRSTDCFLWLLWHQLWGWYERSRGCSSSVPWKQREFRLSQPNWCHAHCYMNRPPAVDKLIPPVVPLMDSSSIESNGSFINCWGAQHRRVCFCLNWGPCLGQS